VASRTGYVIRYYGVPVHWVSKLQSEISLSTTEAEYIALSTAMRDLLPMMTMLKELKDTLQLPEITYKCHANVFEDNKSCEELAKMPKYRPRTKHIAVKFHHFRQAVQEQKLQILHTGLLARTRENLHARAGRKCV